MSATTAQGPGAALVARTVRWVRRRPLLAYFALALGSSWAYELLAFGLLHLPLLPWGLPVPIGPTVAAVLVAAIADGRAGVSDLLRRCVRWRVETRWYLLAFLGVPALMLVAFLALPAGRAAMRLPPPGFALTYLLDYAVYLVVGGALFEEPGWRAFALPRLQERVGPLAGSLALGALWALWHLPLFLLVPGYDGAGADLAGAAVPFAAFAAILVAFSVLLTWAYNATDGSVLVAMLAHASLNTAASFVHPTPVVQLARALAFAAAALLLVVATRGCLGCGLDRAPQTSRPPQTGLGGEWHGRRSDVASRRRAS